ncbi:ABC transporter permease [Chloroflexota bacterium]
MIKVVDIAFKDMTQFFRSLIALVMMIGVPILLTGMFYIMFGGGEDGFEIPVTNVIVVNQDVGEIQFDEGFAGTVPETYTQGAAISGLNSMGDFITEMFQSEAFSDLMSVTVMDDAELAKKAVDNQEAGVAILIPENFSDAFTQPEGQAVVGFYHDPGLTLGPNIVKGIVQQFLDSFSSSQITLQVTFEQLAKGIPIDDGISQAIMVVFFQEMFEQSQDQNASAQLNVQSSTGEEVAGVASAGMISMLMTGMTVFYVFFTGASTAQSLLTEEEKGTLARLFTTPTPHSTVLGGKILSAVLMIIVQITVLMLFGYLVFGIEWGRFITLLPIIFSLTLAASTFGIFLMSWAHTERQAGLMMGSFVTIMGMLGMLPIFVLSMPNPPQMVFTLSHLVPQGWAVEGLQKAMEGGTPTDVILNSVVLLVWAFVFFLVGVIRFRKRFA